MKLNPKKTGLIKLEHSYHIHATKPEKLQFIQVTEKVQITS